MTVLGVDYHDTQPGAALELAEKTGVTYPLVADPDGDLDRATRCPTSRGLPITVFVDADGKVVHVEAGDDRLAEADARGPASQKHLGVAVTS